MDCNKVNLPKEKDWKNIISEVDPMTAMAGVAVAGVAFFAMRKMASKASSLSSASHNVTAVDRPLMTESARL